jgi:hypothetical protein
MPWGNGEANILKLLEILMFSVASVIMLSGAARLERFVPRSLRVTACRRPSLCTKSESDPPVDRTDTLRGFGACVPVGRIGSARGQRIDLHPSRRVAQIELTKWLDRKRRRGYQLRA